MLARIAPFLRYGGNVETPPTPPSLYVPPSKRQVYSRLFTQPYRIFSSSENEPKQRLRACSRFSSAVFSRCASVLAFSMSKLPSKATAIT